MMFFEPYTEMFRQDMRRIVKGLRNKPTVLHRMTCPCCDRKLVNLYYSASQDRYICKECLDKVLSERKENE